MDRVMLCHTKNSYDHPQVFLGFNDIDDGEKLVIELMDSFANTNDLSKKNNLFINLVDLGGLEEIKKLLNSGYEPNSEVLGKAFFCAVRFHVTYDYIELVDCLAELNPAAPYIDAAKNNYYTADLENIYLELERLSPIASGTQI